MSNFNQIITNIQKELNNSTVVVAVSTGIDSMVLLDLLLKLNNVKIIVAHINHHKRTQSDEEQTFIEKFCCERKIKCYVKELFFESSANFQETARIKRYEFFEEVLKKEKAKYLLTAHHATDNLETILIRLIKSTSHKGYAGIEKLQKKGDYLIYRPLLDVSKKDICEYQKEQNIKYFNDDSNDQDDYLRNRIRHNIIPEMEKENPSLYKAIEIYQEHILETNKLLFKEINSFIKEEVLVQNNIISFKEESILKYNNYLQEQILFEILKKYSLSKILIEELIDQIKSPKNKIINTVTKELTMIKEYGYIKFGKLSKIDEFSLKVETTGQYKLPNDITLVVDKNICYFETENNKLCYNIKDLPLYIRTRKEGDKILVNGKLKNLSDYLTNKKVSHFIRESILVVTNELNQVIDIIEIK